MKIFILLLFYFVCNFNLNADKVCALTSNYLVQVDNPNFEIISLEILILGIPTDTINTVIAISKGATAGEQFKIFKMVQKPVVKNLGCTI